MDPAAVGRPLKVGWATLPFLVVGVAAITFAGLYSAATARSATYHSAWLVAYLVLIVGLAQVALGIGQWWLIPGEQTSVTTFAQLVFFNLGNAGVIVGSLFALPILVDVGSVAIIAALWLFLRMVLNSKRWGIVMWMYLALAAVLLVSVLIGVYFAHTGSR